MVTDLNEQIFRQADLIDSGFGKVGVEPTSDHIDFGQMLGFLEKGQAALWRRRCWLHGLFGRQKTFWLPSANPDLKLAASAAALDTDLTVTSIGETSGYDGRDVLVQLADGTRLYRAIDASAVGAGTDTITLDAALGVAVDPEDVYLFSFLSRVRLNADTVTISYRANGLSAIACPVTEVKE